MASHEGCLPKNHLLPISANERAFGVVLRIERVVKLREMVKRLLPRDSYGLTNIGCDSYVADIRPEIGRIDRRGRRLHRAVPLSGPPQHPSSFIGGQSIECLSHRRHGFDLGNRHNVLLRQVHVPSMLYDPGWNPYGTRLECPCKGCVLVKHGSCLVATARIPCWSKLLARSRLWVQFSVCHWVCFMTAGRSCCGPGPPKRDLDTTLRPSRRRNGGCRSRRIHARVCRDRLNQRLPTWTFKNRSLGVGDE